VVGALRADTLISPGLLFVMLSHVHFRKSMTGGLLLRR